MAMSEPSDSGAMQFAKEEPSSLRTALPSRSMSSRAGNLSRKAHSPPPEEGSQRGRSPSPLKAQRSQKSPSMAGRPASHPISPAPSANEPASSDGMADAAPLPPSSIAVQSGQVCR